MNEISCILMAMFLRLGWKNFLCWLGSKIFGCLAALYDTLDFCSDSYEVFDPGDRKYGRLRHVGFIKAYL